ncbi:hypothetical protein [Actimicrobium sp. CCI2.3]|uniref:hypothetical protein n=1 Tax=Actimicrobium sp. CCI2.3 TaxID=3048616 RepID=UPI002AB34AB1|nr:hypothetical protein [Actimicrobium sp. CCI2.3]MDY7573083.1 hypothetical protein [Actimicrobium sp. CCI2.3]MEB0020880.1 hypothetical protein [Actimicrobium sp. CCI2.3]
MIQVIEIDIGRLGVHLPRGEVGMVIAQPYVDFIQIAPFSLTPAVRAAALAGIDATLAVARECAHGAKITHFTIFPECTLPGLVGFDHITAAMDDASWPTGTIIIGGFEGLSHEQFGELVQRPGTSYDDVGSSLGSIRPDQWVNCCATWAKLESGEVRCWIQTKIEPAGVELEVSNQSMFKGKSVFLFKGTYSDINTPYRFATLICFDWIGVRDQRRVWEWLLQDIEHTAAAKEAQLPLTWLFVAQCNPGPSHASFMSQVQPFFNPILFPSVLRDGTCLVMANVAGNVIPGVADKYGQSALIFATDRFMKPENMPTVCAGGEFQRPGNPLENFKDAVFRERGACIHSFRQLNPLALPPGAAGRRFAIADATVHPYPGTEDPRTPSGLVSPVVKWVNDQLDDSNKSLQIKYPDSPLAAAAGVAHRRSVYALRWLPPDALSKTVLIATPEIGGAPDKWRNTQSKAIKHVLHSFSILEVAQYSVTFHGNGAQATIMKGDASIEVVAVVGGSHEECDRHVSGLLPDHRGQLLLVSRDEDNTSWNPRMRTLFDQVAEPTKELNFTDPTSAVIRVGYRDVLNGYHDSVNEAELRKALDAAIS